MDINLAAVVIVAIIAFTIIVVFAVKSDTPSTPARPTAPEALWTYENRSVSSCPSVRRVSSDIVSVCTLSAGHELPHKYVTVVIKEHDDEDLS